MYFCLVPDRYRFCRADSDADYFQRKIQITIKSADYKKKMEKHIKLIFGYLKYTLNTCDEYVS